MRMASSAEVKQASDSVYGANSSASARVPSDVHDTLKTLVAFAAAIVLTASSAARGDTDITGTWQGVLPLPSRPIRIVVRISRGDGGELTANNYSIDETAEPFFVRPITLKADQLDFMVPEIGGTYSGKLSADGTTIAGTWTQRRSWPLVFTRATKETAWPTDHVRDVRYVSVEKDVRLEVLDWGGAGRPVVLLAGLGSTGRVFDMFATKLAAHYHVYGVTRRGFGDSSHPTPANGNYSADRLGDDVLAIIDALKIDRPVLIGHSIAGEELSSIGTRHPEKVAGLVYLDAAYSYAFYDPAHAMKPPRAGSMPPIEQAIVEGEQKYTGPIGDPILAIYAVPHDRGDMFANDPAAKAAAEAKDIAQTGGQADAFQRGLPSARVVRLAHADHNVFMSNEADVLREIQAFIAKLP